MNLLSFSLTLFRKKEFAPSGAQVTELSVFLTLDHWVMGLSPTGGEILAKSRQPSIE